MREEEREREREREREIERDRERDRQRERERDGERDRGEGCRHIDRWMERDGEVEGIRTERQTGGNPRQRTAFHPTNLCSPNTNIVCTFQFPLASNIVIFKASYITIRQSPT